MCLRRFVIVTMELFRADLLGVTYLKLQKHFYDITCHSITTKLFYGLSVCQFYSNKFTHCNICLCWLLPVSNFTEIFMWYDRRNNKRCRWKHFYSVYTQYECTCLSSFYIEVITSFQFPSFILSIYIGCLQKLYYLLLFILWSRIECLGWVAVLVFPLNALEELSFALPLFGNTRFVVKCFHNEKMFPEGLVNVSALLFRLLSS